MQSEVFYSCQEDTFILLSTRSSETPRYYVWDDTTSSYSYKNISLNMDIILLKQDNI